MAKRSGIFDAERPHDEKSAVKEYARIPKDHPLIQKRDRDLSVIKRLARRAVGLYAEHEIMADERDVLMDLTACHFTAQKLRLDDLLASDDANFLHDVAGINKHLDRINCILMDGFSPRFSHHTAA